MSRSADLGFLVTLSRLELLRLRAFWRFASRDIVFDVCVVAGIAMLYGTARRGFDMAAAAPAPARLALAFGLGVLLLLSAYAGPGSRARERLVSGPFHALVSDPGRMALWMSVRAAGFALLGCVLVSLVLATIDPLAAAGFLGLSGAGARAPPS